MSQANDERDRRMVRTKRESRCFIVAYALHELFACNERREMDHRKEGDEERDGQPEKRGTEITVATRKESQERQSRTSAAWTEGRGKENRYFGAHAQHELRTARRGRKNADTRKGAT